MEESSAKGGNIGSGESVADVDGDIFRITDFPMYLMATIRHRNSVNLSADLSPHGITPVMWRVLALLQEGEGYNIARLADFAGVERSNMSRIVAAMEEKGLLTRKAPAADKRQRPVFLTAKGRRKYAAVQPVVAARYARNFDGMSEKDMQNLMDLLRRVRDNVHRW